MYTEPPRVVEPVAAHVFITVISSALWGLYGHCATGRVDVMNGEL
jgi:hypothetical protein